jgi:cysteine desulfurase
MLASVQLALWPNTGSESVRQLRELHRNLLQVKFGNRVVLNGHTDEHLPNTLNVSFVNKVGTEILARIEGVAASTVLPVIPVRWSCLQF